MKWCLWALRRPAAAFATDSPHILKCCNPIGQFHEVPVAPVGFVLFSNKVDVDLPLGVETIPGKFHRNRLYGVETYSEQTNKQTDRQTFIFIYIDRWTDITSFWKKKTTGGLMTISHNPLLPRIEPLVASKSLLRKFFRAGLYYGEASYRDFLVEHSFVGIRMTVTSIFPTKYWSLKSKTWYTNGDVQANQLCHYCYGYKYMWEDGKNLSSQNYNMMDDVIL